MSDKDYGESSPKNRKTAMREGLLSFDVEEVKRLSESDSPNAESYKYLYQAVNTRPNTIKNLDDAYPQTAEETHQMKTLVEKAKSVLVDRSDTYFQFCVADLDMILQWSGRRHWNILWPVIVGVILTVLFLSWRVDRKQQDVDRNQEIVDRVKDWSEADTVLTWEDTPEDAYSTTGFVKYGSLSAINYKLYTLLEKKSQYTSSMAFSRNYASMADTAQSKATRKNLEKLSEESRSNAEKYRKEFDRINSMDFKDIQEMALDEYGVWVKGSKSERRAVRAWNIFFILLIPVYIFSQRPYGYTLTRYRVESETLKGISKWTYAVSGMLVGSAMAIPYIDTIIKYRNGTTERTQDAGTNAPVIIMKAALYIAAFAIVCIVSCLLMLYLTIQGLRRNYDWAPLISKIRKN